jgi:hypothetical protein
MKILMRSSSMNILLQLLALALLVAAGAGCSETPTVEHAYTRGYRKPVQHTSRPGWTAAWSGNGCC